MNFNERQEVGKIIVQTAIYYNRQMTKEVAAMMVNDLCDIPAESVMEAYSEYRKNPNNKQFPMPAQIRAIVYPELNLNERDVANTLARKIYLAVGKYGWTWELGISSQSTDYWEGGGKRWGSFKEAVIAELGAIGWHIICSRGGWLNVINSAKEMEEGVFIAQMRDQLESSMRLERSGVDVTQISMPAPKQKELQSLNEIQSRLNLVTSKSE